MENKQLKQHFSKLKQFESQPSERVWNQLEDRLKTHKNKRFQRNFNFTVAAALVILFTVVFTQIFHKEEISEPTASEIQQVAKDTIKIKTQPSSPSN